MLRVTEESRRDWAFLVRRVSLGFVLLTGASCGADDATRGPAEGAAPRAMAPDSEAKTSPASAALHAGYAPTMQAEAHDAWAYLSELEGSTYMPNAVNSEFGISLAISGDTAVVGAGGPPAYVFVQSGLTWSLQQDLSPGGTSNQGFGRSVAISEDTIVIGAPYGDTNGFHSGSADVFVRSGPTWSWQANLLPGDGGAAFALFGHAVAISGDIVVIGAPQRNISAESGSAYVFMRSANCSTIWCEQAKLSPDNTSSGDLFGHSVAISGDMAVVSAIGDDEANDNAGAIYTFLRSGDDWLPSPQQPKLSAPIGGASYAGDNFGTSVAISGDALVVGAVGDYDYVESSAGTAYVFVRDGDTWDQKDKLSAPMSEFFGRSVAISGDTLVVGASDLANNIHLFGSAYVFVRSVGDTWSRVQKLLPVNGGGGNKFGWSVAASGEAVLVGAPNRGANGSVFPFFSIVGDSCTDAAQCPTGYCNDGVCCNVPCDGPCDVCNGPQAAAPGICTNLAADDTPANVCGLYTCSSTSGSCPTSCSSDAGCISGNYCASDSTCKTKKDLGQECNPSSDCATEDCDLCWGHCVDGVCCNRECTHQCEACNVPGQEGTCAPVSGEPRGNRPSCEINDNPCHAPLCDGKSRDTCDAYRENGTLCGVLACERDSLTVGACNEGDCVEAFRVPCNGFGCNETENTCKASCTDREDCAKGYACSNGLCIPSSTCENVDDCVSPYVCDALTKTCILPGSWGTAQPGCACVMPGRDQTSRSRWLLPLAVAAGIILRRRGRAANRP